ncbi:alpha-1,4-glucan--maltose-1-phosphate maltosyltransferase [Acidobacteria bacterium AB60]|nr:alpha-1,4-glucan--maltose-1-phosphate maltosyltransferase [Acidobacteria bacterium AB60]
MKPSQGRSRVVIEHITPQVDGGRHPACRVLGDTVVVNAVIFSDGHDHVSARLLYRPESESEWRSTQMIQGVNDQWSGTFVVDQIGPWQYAVLGSVDHFDTWVSDLRKRIAAQAIPVESQTTASRSREVSIATVDPAGGLPSSAIFDSPGGLEAGPQPASQDVQLALRTGALLTEQAAARATAADAKTLRETARFLNALAERNLSYYDFPLDAETLTLIDKYPDLSLARQSDVLSLWVDRPRAQFSSWYELFPRSASPTPGKHGTFADVEAQLPEIAAMGFDIVYLPPIHPIGRAFRKGKNNTVTAEPGDVGSPWAIGDSAAIAPDAKAHPADNGGHKSILPALGTFADFESLVKACRARDLELALDIAFQCSPDHPWVKEHPTWFVIRPDGSIQYAENPPKKYQDIYPLNFESPDWQSLWDELYSVFEFWIQRGVKVFRVDNPHTKAFPFWEWCLGTLRAKYPDTLFLAEAFTRPHVMYWLAKTGYTQSYTYFTWRTSKWELTSYMEELTTPPVSDFFRPNFWPNTPDILHKVLQDGGRPAFMLRLILAATLTANYGIYGPAYELCENIPARPAPGKTESEEYMDSEKYEIRQRSRNAPDSLVPLITRLNQIRRAHPALQANTSLRFHATDNPQLICYSKTSTDKKDVILVVVNLDPLYGQTGWTDVDLDALGLMPGQSFLVDDLLNDAQYTWHGRRNYVALRPGTQPAHIFRIVPQV